MSEQAKVGLLVLIAGSILAVTVFYMTGAGLKGQYVEYKMYLKFAGGLEPGAPVRYGGLKAGRVSSLRVAPNDPSLIEIKLDVKRDIPVRTDSVAAISQLGMLGENYIEIQPGKAPTRLAAGSTIPAAEIQDLTTLMRKMNALLEQAQPLVADLHTNLNTISTQVEALLTDLHDVTGEANRQHFADILKTTDQMLATNSPKIDLMATNFQNASAKIDPLMSDLRAATAKIDKLTSDLNLVVTENRKELQNSLTQLTKTLETARTLITDLNTSLLDNSGNIDATMANLRVTTDNLKDLSDTLKQRPFSLIRVVPKPERQMPGALSPKQSKRAQATARSTN